MARWACFPLFPTDPAFFITASPFRPSRLLYFRNYTRFIFVRIFNTNTVVFFYKNNILGKSPDPGPGSPAAQIVRTPCFLPGRYLPYRGLKTRDTSAFRPSAIGVGGRVVFLWPGVRCATGCSLPGIATPHYGAYHLGLFRLRNIECAANNPLSRRRIPRRASGARNARTVRSWARNCGAPNCGG